MQTLLVLLVLAAFAAALYVLIFKVEWSYPRAEARGKIKGLDDLSKWIAEQKIEPEISVKMVNIISKRREQLQKELEEMTACEGVTEHENGD